MLEGVQLNYTDWPENSGSFGSGGCMRIGIQTWGSDGDIRPFIALANGLARKGHEVSLTITSVDGKDYSMAGRRNLRIVQTASVEWERHVILDIMRKLLRSRDPFTQLRVVLRFFFDPIVEEMYAHSKKLAETNDVLVGHFVVHPLKTAADKAGRPYVTVTLNHLGVPTRFKAPLGLPSPGTWFNPVWWALAKGIVNAGFKKQVNTLRTKEGLQPSRDVLDDIFYAKDLSIIAVSRVFCDPMPDWHGRHYVCGFFNIEEEDDTWKIPPDLRAFLREGPLPVYMTFGSMLSLDPDPGRITKLLVDSALGARVRAIVQSRWGDIRDIPRHQDIYRIEKVPHHYLFPLCSAVIHHGGAGTTHAATRSGCPSVIVQHFLDQRFWGQELRRLRIAPPVLDRRSVTPEKLSRAIDSVLHTRGMKERAEELGRVMREERGVESAVDLIETAAKRQR
jgi:sterol 3beta-glucosyltransferase